jgi:hypothetical protein
MMLLLIFNKNAMAHKTAGPDDLFLISWATKQEY